MPFNSITCIKCCTRLTHTKPYRLWLLSLLSLVFFSGFSVARQTEVTREDDEILTQNSVILLYHHVADNTPRSTSISPDMFRQHMHYLKKHHTVLPLQKVVNAIKNNAPLPANSVVVTFDDGYKNIFQNAHPVMLDMGFPYTIFINPEEIGNNASQLTWEQVEEMRGDGVTFANHTLDHLHMLNGRVTTTETAWLEKVWQNVSDAEAMLKQHTGESLKYLAYPFGEFNQTLTQKLAQEGYIGFGQHSGAIGPYSNFQALPRFPAAGIYANLQTLKTKLNSLAMPVLSSSYEGQYVPEISKNVSKEATPPPITLTIKGNDVRLSQVSCFFSGDPIETHVTENTVTFSIEGTLPVGRSRVNCTAPSNAQSGRYYWYSQPFFVADEKGNYPN